MKEYNPKKIELYWQERWLDEKVFVADDSGKKQYYQLETFPYPSAAGLHVGHPKGYIAEDIHARYLRMRGLEVLYTMGWDAFGLPTENYAIKVKQSPQEVAGENIKNFKRQLQMFGLSYDWDREINTASPEYYKWTQWLFIQLFKKGLAYQKKADVNWCTQDQTVLANEQVVDGRCERCGGAVEQREMEQWFFKITDYTDRLLADLDGLDWPAATVKRQQDWVGKSEGARIAFKLKTLNSELKTDIEVFTTRQDTLFGATYLVLAPEHERISNLKSQISNFEEVKAYVEATKKKTPLMREEGAGEKTGVELKGIKAVNPATKEEIPVWVADYVLMGYGTGAIMAVPAHDQRDLEFALTHDLDVKLVMRTKSHIASLQYANSGREISDEGMLDAIRLDSIKKNRIADEGEGVLVNSGEFSGMPSEEAKWKITEAVGGERKVQYRLRDWSVSRQRYWGAPIPIIDCDACGMVPVPEKDLPVVLPELTEYRPKGMPPLASSEAFMNVACPNCKTRARRVPETLDTFVDSSWYYLRYTDPHNEEAIFDKKKMAHWMPVDLYVIGAEHAVLHLLYSRFITKFLHDEGCLGFTEPFKKLRHLGLILGADGQKMSKSRGNVVNPDELVAEFGADAVRLYEMFMGPFEEGQPWDPKGVIGTERFLKRVWKFIASASDEGKKIKTAPASSETYRMPDELKRLLHKTIKKIEEDIEALHFNTAVSALMILLNEAEKISPAVGLPRSFHETFLKLLHPFAPHLAQELWSQLGHGTFLDFEPWPEYDEKLMIDEEIQLIVQVNGKVRDTVKVSADISEAEAKKIALASERVARALGGIVPKKTIFIPGKLINLVV